MGKYLANPVVYGTLAVVAVAVWLPLVTGWGAHKESSRPLAAGESGSTAAEESRSLAECRKASAQFQADVARWSSAQDVAAAWRGTLDEQHRRVLASPWTMATYGDLEYIEAEYRALSNATPPFPDIMVVSRACGGQ